MGHKRLLRGAESGGAQVGGGGGKVDAHGSSLPHLTGQGHTSQPHPAAGERSCTTQAPAPISGWTSVTVPPGSR